ncbi:MAG: AI-2E family transporter [Bacteroidales bacterium]|jgi:predicted PurR-regulated permease PerM|nr:AI-2E family transporter [Bacteroidales bacterium]MDD3299469.1 AI-2E family transporter [Bacteroidales bacterium]MDD3844037.1 AI-2E family transporter [Bacteroidales bacterium]MDD4619053.1 AI-2E family transporter [Bacteroidales bacterium]
MNKLVKYIIGIAATLVIGYITWYFSDIVIYIIVSAVLSLMGKPLMNKLLTIKIGKFHISRSLSAAITLLAMLGIFLSLFLVIAPLLGTFFTNIASLDFDSISMMIAEPFRQVNQTIIEIFPSIGGGFKIENLMFEEIRKILTSSSIASLFASVATLLLNTVLGVLIVLFITFFFLKEQNMFDNMVIALFPERYEENAKRALKSVNHLLVRYFIGVSIQIISITTLNTLGLHFIAGIELSYALVLAFMTGVFNIVPYVGPWIGAATGIIITITTQIPEAEALSSLIIKMAAVFGTTQLVDNFVFQPFIFSSSVKAHPLEIFLVILIAAGLAGVLGMLVAIPVYTVVRVFAKEFFSNFRLVQKLTDNIEN